MNSVARRIEVLTGSLRCFFLGAISLVPLLGPAFAVWALVVFWEVRERPADRPNPAQSYLWAGLVLALMGLMLNGVTILALCVAVFPVLTDEVFRI